MFRLLSVLLIAAIATQAHSIDFGKTKSIDAGTSLSHSSVMSKKSTTMDVLSYQNLSKSQKSSLSGIFDLKPEEYEKFLYYMNNTMDGYEYDQNINPNLVLAMHATNQQDYYRYLKNVARADHDAVARLLKVTVDYPVVMRQLYPNERPMMTPAMRAAMNNQLKKTDVVQLFCHINGATCANILSTIRKVIDTTGSRLDLFFINHPTQAQIVSFAQQNNISPAQVSDHQVTLNYGDKAFSLLEHQAGKSLEAPYLLVRRDGKSVAVVLGGVNA